MVSRTTGLALVVAVSIAQHAAAQTTVPADRFVDSVGVNVHLHYDRTIYRDNFPLVQTRLTEMKVRHVRDGLIDTTWQGYYDRHNALGALGIKGLFITSPGQSAALLQSYPTRMSSSFEGYEAPNEHDQSNDPNWVATLRASLTRLRALRDTPALAAYPIHGPSLTHETSYTALGDVSALIDIGNLHNYFGGHHPGTTGWGDNGYGSIDWNLRLVRAISGSKPITTTETGYWNQLRVGSVPVDVAGKYMPRLLLEQFRKGIARTYIYELADYTQPGGGVTSDYGILNADGSPKPAYTAVKSLLTMLHDPGAAFPAVPLPYTVVGGTATLRHMAFQKRTGTYFLAIWVEDAGYNVDSRVVSAAASQNVTVTVGSNVRHVATHRWQANGTVARSAASAAGSIPVQVTDTLMMLEFQPGGPNPPTNVRIVPY
jgi:hypothetical protein